MADHLKQLAVRIEAAASPELSTMFRALLSEGNTLGPAELNQAVNFLQFILDRRTESKSQLFQDLLVLFILGETAGNFIEAGATDGVTLSNTYLLETAHGWNGVAAEPAKCWRDKLTANRKCRLDFRCLWSRSGETLPFSETDDKELSTIATYAGRDYHAKARTSAKSYAVETVSLNDLAAALPSDLDYLSLDTEGSELAILSAFDFSRRAPKLITVEHNYTADRDDLFTLLRTHGYVRIFTVLSCWDDWYVHRSVSPGRATS